MKSLARAGPPLASGPVDLRHARLTAPTQAFGPAHTEGVIGKDIGQPAGSNCSDDADVPCDLNFNVTAIGQGVSCDAAAEGLGPNQQFLRFDVEAFSGQQTFEFPTPPIVLAN
jgi:hypothetical protein